MQPDSFNNSAPFSQEAEEGVIGAVLVNPSAFMTVAAFLEPDDFFLVRHAYIWQAMVNLNNRDEIIDILTVAEELSNQSVLDEIGGRPYLIQLINNTPSSVYAEAYGRLVERTSIRRGLLKTADEIRQLAIDEELSIDSVLSESEAKLFSVTDNQVKREFVPMWDALDEYYERMEYMLQNKQESLGVPSGFMALDEILGGFQKSDLIVFAGRPGMGKTSFLLTIAMNAARVGARVAIFTMEMGVEQMVQRMVSMETAINVQKLRLAKLTAQETSRFTEAVGRISHFPIFIDDTPAMSPIEMRTKCRRLAHEHGLDMVIIDYMQLMNAGKAYENNRVQEISFISRNLKELARELNVPVISAAQLSRAVEQRQDKRPVLSDLRESGCLTGDTLIYSPTIDSWTRIDDLMNMPDAQVMTLNMDTAQLETAPISNAFCTGVKSVYRLMTQSGRMIRATANHKFLTPEGWLRLDELTLGMQVACSHVMPNQIVVGDHMPSQDTAFWDEIVSIMPDGEAKVYDLTIEPHHNFVADGLIVHNSIEQDSDIVMFLYRDEVYNEATEYPNIADVIISKHRNGPTGIIQLFFEKELTKFRDAALRNVNLSDLE